MLPLWRRSRLLCYPATSGDNISPLIWETPRPSGWGGPVGLHRRVWSKLKCCVDVCTRNININVHVKFIQTPLEDFPINCNIMSIYFQRGGGGGACVCLVYEVTMNVTKSPFISSNITSPTEWSRRWPFRKDLFKGYNKLSSIKSVLRRHIKLKHSRSHKKY